MPTTLIVDLDSEDGRYVLRRDGDVVAFADITTADGIVTVPHVETEPAHRSNGYAGLLMDGLVDDLRARSLRIRPLCPFAAAYMADRPETHDLYA